MRQICVCVRVCAWVCVCVCVQVRLEWPTDLAVDPSDSSLYVLENNVVLRVSQTLQVSIVAGRPMHCLVPGIDYSLSPLAIHAALEGATAIALDHHGTLFIAETDEKKINRVRQVRVGGRGSGDRKSVV